MENLCFKIEIYFRKARRFTFILMLTYVKRRFYKIILNLLRKNFIIHEKEVFKIHIRIAIALRGKNLLTQIEVTQSVCSYAAFMKWKLCVDYFF